MNKGAKLVVVLLLVSAGAAIAYAGAAPEGYKGVADVVADPAKFDGKTVELKAAVVPGSLDRTADPLTFVVADGASALPVTWDPSQPLPDHEAGGTIEGKNVILTGVIVVEGGAPHLLATGMKVGCASKYRAA